MGQYGNDKDGQAMYACARSFAWVAVLVVGASFALLGCPPETGPAAALGFELQPEQAPLQVGFTDLSVAGSDAITGWLWDFGDAGTSAERNPVHQYAAPGTYTVTLTVTTAVGSHTSPGQAVAVVGGEGLSAWYDTGETRLEGPISHGFSTLCSSLGMYLYEGHCAYDAPVNWGNGAFDAVWTGCVYLPTAGDYTFTGRVEGAAFVNVNGTLVAEVDGAEDYESTVSVDAPGWVPIHITYYSNGVNNRLRLSWVLPGSQEEAPVPRYCLSASVCVPGDGPAITVQPLSIAVDPGVYRHAVNSPPPPTVSVEATGSGPLHYQWRRNGVPLGGDGSTLNLGVYSGSILRTWNVTEETEGEYDCLIWNAYGWVLSDVAVITVNDPPTVVAFGLNGIPSEGMTSRRTVQLVNTCSGVIPTHYMAGESADFSDAAGWLPYSSDPEFVLSELQGSPVPLPSVRTVYFKVKRNPMLPYGITLYSEVVQASIVLSSNSL